MRARAHPVTHPRQERRRPSQTDAPPRPRRPPPQARARSRDAPGVLGAVPALDRLIHERLRLGIVSALAVNELLTFNELKHLLGTTDGNLSVHARKLEEAAYVTCASTSRGANPGRSTASPLPAREASSATWTTWSPDPHRPWRIGPPQEGHLLNRMFSTSPSCTT